MDSTYLLLHEYLADTTSRGVLLIDGAGLIAFVNRSFFAQLGCGELGVKGVRFDQFLTELPLQNGWQGVKQELFLARVAPLLAKDTHQMDLYFQPNRWLRMSGRSIASGGYALTVTDVTSFHQAEFNTRQINKNTIKSLADIAENRDHDTCEHVLKVARLTHEIAWDLKEQGYFQERLDTFFLTQIGLASILHDVGKVAVPDAVLLKPGRLTLEEMEVMRGHAQAGYRIIHKIRDLQTDSAYFDLASTIALSHHEQYAGGGYPFGLQGEDIPLEARIVGVSDVYDALSSWRPYKDPWPEEKVQAFINEKAGEMFDPLVVQALHHVLQRRRQQCQVRWDAAMSVGDGTMDKDHRILIDLINQLGLASERMDAIIMDFILDELYNYTVRHFQREEVYMKSVFYPKLEQHVRIHSDFAIKVTELRHNFLRNPDPALSTALMPMLGAWLSNHIQGMDQDYKYFILDYQSKGKGVEGNDAGLRSSFGPGA